MTQILLERRRTERGPLVAAGVTVAVAIGVAATLAWRSPTPETLRLTLRSTARLSSALLLLTFSASSLRALFPGDWTAWVLRNRRYLGLAFGGVHLIHGALVLTLAVILHRGDVTKLSSAPAVAGGVFVYAVIIALMATSRDQVVVAMGVRRWRRLHRFGIRLLYTVFLLDFASKAIVDSPAYWAPVAVYLGALALRVAAGRRRRLA